MGRPSRWRIPGPAFKTQSATGCKSLRRFIPEPPHSYLYPLPTSFPALPLPSYLYLFSPNTTYGQEVFGYPESTNAN